MTQDLANREGVSSLHFIVIWLENWHANTSARHSLVRKTPWCYMSPNCIKDHRFFWRTLNCTKHFHLGVYHHHNSALDSKSSFNESSLVKSSNWLGDSTSSWSSPKIRAVNLLASKSRSGHSDTIRLAP